MHINKRSELWKSPPWHVKVSTWGSSKVQHLKFWRNLSFILGLFFFISGDLVTVFLDSDVNYARFSGLALAACMYWAAIDWIGENKQVTLD